MSEISIRERLLTTLNVICCVPSIRTHIACCLLTRYHVPQTYSNEPCIINVLARSARVPYERVYERIKNTETASRLPLPPASQVIQHPPPIHNWPGYHNHSPAHLYRSSNRKKKDNTAYPLFPVFSSPGFRFTLFTLHRHHRHPSRPTPCLVDSSLTVLDALPRQGHWP